MCTLVPRTILLWVSFFFGLLVLNLLLNWLPTLLVGDGLTALEAAGAQIGFNLGGAIAALFMGHLLAGRLRFMGVVVTLVTLPIMLVTIAEAPAEVGVVSLSVFLLGCTCIAGQAFLYAIAPVIYPAAIRGIGVGAAVAIGRIGSMLGPKLGGVLKSAGHSPSQLFLDLVPIAIVGSICALLLARESAERRQV
jgi:MFS transporter, AAHS family, 3-hydroxyphenylpropionic acid transporter